MIVETLPEDFASLIDGRAPRAFALTAAPIAPVDVLRMLADVDARVRQTFSPASWLIVDGSDAVGLCSITRPPTDGVIDIGYGIAPDRHRRGIASAAIGAVVTWARNAPAVCAITADTSPDNTASQRVLARNGFVIVGNRIDDEDGALICWRHALGETDLNPVTIQTD